MNIKRFTIVFFSVLLFVTVGCKITLNEDSVPEELRPLFFEGSVTLEEVVNQGVDSLKDMEVTLPPALEDDYKKADQVCTVDGEIDLSIITTDPITQEELTPFFEFYCDAKSKYNSGVAKNADLVQSLSCVVGLAKLLRYELKNGSDKSSISTSRAKDCFTSASSRTWFEENIESGISSNILVEVEKLAIEDNVTGPKFSHVAKISINSFSAELRFLIGKEINGVLLSFISPISRTTFGISTQLMNGHAIVRYDLMSNFEDFRNGQMANIINRSRLYLHLKKVGPSLKVADLDFWALHSDQTNFVIDQVSGGTYFGLRGSRHKLEITEESVSVNNIYSKCLNQETCLSREIRLPSKDKIYHLGKKEMTINSMQKVVSDNLLFTHERAHFGLTPNKEDRKWLLIDAPISNTQRSFMKPTINSNELYLSGGTNFENGVPEPATDSLKVDLKSLQISSIEDDRIPSGGAINNNCDSSRSYSGVFQNDEIYFEFGGIKPEIGQVNTGVLRKKNSTQSCDDDLTILVLNDDVYEKNEIEDNVPSILNPVVVFTGQHLIIYGGLIFSEEGKVASSNMGLIVDIHAKKIRQMNSQFSPEWITQGVWAEDRLIVWGGYKVVYDGFYPEIKPHANGAMYSLATNSWEPINPGPLKPRLGHQLIWSNDRLLIFSGQDKISQLDGYPPFFVPGAAVFIPGVSNRIYFSENYYQSRRSSVLNLRNETGEFYLEGKFTKNAVVEIYQGAGCKLSRKGEYVRRELLPLGYGKLHVTLPLKVGRNVVSVLVNEYGRQTCTNALTFNRL